MTFKPSIWFPIAAILSAINLAAVAFAVMPASPWHATAHAGLAVGFGLWAQRLRQGSRRAELPPPAEAYEELEAEVNVLRQELGEMQERVDFAERVLAQAPEPRREGPPR